MQKKSSNSKRVLSVFSLVMINVIAIDSLRNLPANAETGFSIAFFYIIGTILFLIPCVLITAELATHHPKTGGTYVWVKKAFGVKWGFFNIWLQWIYNVFWYPTILSFMAANIAYLIDPNLASQKGFMLIVIIGLFLIATFLNSFGMRLSSALSTISAIVGTIIPMLLIIALGTIWIADGKTLAVIPSVADFFPNLLHMKNLAFIVIVLFSMVGLEMSAVHAEEVKNPQRDYPRALLYSSILIVLTLILSSTAIAIVVPRHELNIISGLDQAFATFLNAFHMHWLLPIIVLFIILGGFGGMAAWVIGPTKGLMVAAEDGSMPKFLGARNKAGVPITVLFAQAVIVIILSTLFLAFKYISTWYWILSDLTAQLALLFYIVLFAAAIKLRSTTPVNPKAFRIPGGKVGIWIVGMVGILTCFGAILVGFIPPESVKIQNVFVYESILIAGVIVFSVLPFLIYRSQQKKESSIQNNS